MIKAGDSAFKGLDVHHVSVSDSELIRYISGKCDTEEAAIEHRKTVAEKFPDAYVVKVSNGVVTRVK